MNVEADHAPLSRFLADTAQSITDACTRCGACVEICPVVPHAGIAEAPPESVVGGVLDVLRGDSARLQPPSDAWAHQCDGCGKCIPACPEGINPRTMLMVANSMDARTHTKTPELFRKMSRAIRLMAAMQIPPDEIAQLMRPPARRDVDVIFYVGCNAVRTPHLLFNAMYVLDALDVDYEVLGGPAACCGIIHTKWEGEFETGGRVSDGALDRFGDYHPRRVLSWCPSCQLHLGETLHGYRETGFGFDHVTQFMLENVDRLAARFREAVPMRVLVHAHDGMDDLGRNVAALLGRVPELEVADIAWESGYTCGGSGADRSPGLKAERRAATLERAQQPGIDALVTLYHGCHMQFAATAEGSGVRVVNFTDILVRALGAEPRADAMDAWRAMRDLREIIRDAQPNLESNHMDLDPGWLEEVLPEVFTFAEFKGGLQAFGSGAEPARRDCPTSAPLGHLM